MDFVKPLSAEARLREAAEFFRLAAKEAALESLSNPDIPTPVDPDVAEFMGASEDPSFGDGDTYPDPEYLEWLEGTGRADGPVETAGGPTAGGKDKV